MELTTEQKSQKTLDTIEVQNVLSKHECGGPH